MILLNNERVALGLMLIKHDPDSISLLAFVCGDMPSVGLVMGVYAAKMGLSGALAAFALGILPHGILEMSALIIGV